MPLLSRGSAFGGLVTLRQTFARWSHYAALEPALVPLRRIVGGLHFASIAAIGNCAAVVHLALGDLPPSPPGEQATACEDQAGNASTCDGAGNTWRRLDRET
jgi:hypothetical protein